MKLRPKKLRPNDSTNTNRIVARDLESALAEMDDRPYQFIIIGDDPSKQPTGKAESEDS